MSDKFKQYAQGAHEYFGPQYDSDEDLDEETRKKIKSKENVWDSAGAEKAREEGWKKADLYPKIKSSLKAAWYGDKRRKKD